MKLHAVSLELKAANEFVARLHRHHTSVHRDRFRCGAADEKGTLRGVVQVGRPVSRHMDDGQTCEVVRLCTDGCPNACGFLYGRAAQAAKALGFRRIITAILCTEKGGNTPAIRAH